MLAQLLEQGGCSAISFPLDPSLEMIGLLEPTENDTFCVSALPPFAFARARTLTRQIQQRFPQTKIIVGVWGFTGDKERAVQRFQPGRPEKLVTSFTEAVEFAVSSPEPALQ